MDSTTSSPARSDARRPRTNGEPQGSMRRNPGNGWSSR
jgi:hypothetical protein